MIITSKSNKIVAYVSSLKNKKARRESGAYVVEGVKMVSEAIAAGKTIETIIVSESASRKLPFAADNAVIVSDEIFKRISDEITPQGVLAVLKVDGDKLPKKQSGICVLLDGTSDPGNLGTIFRTCAAVGLKDIYLVNCCDPYSPKTVRASMSGIFRVNVYECDYEQALSAIGDIPLLVTDMGGESVFSFEPPQRYCVVVGNEANGVSKTLKDKATRKIGIPMAKTSESLNAAVALSITLYALTEGRGKSMTNSGD